ncbi:alpha/beta fold hydrolase [Streptomyces sp. CG1]|uniref:alpha/beta fold hydrolase n=1 Tax=Streptomyces sp. CG1 TaxID=1287523 RepID=UPI0034E26994
MQIIMAAMPIGIYWAAGSIGHGHLAISVGTLVAYTGLQQGLFGPTVSLLGVGITLQSSLALFERVFEYLDLPVEMPQLRRRSHPKRLDVARSVEVRATVRLAGASTMRLNTTEGMSMYVEAADGTRLAYEDYGRGEPIVFVASAMLDADMWEYQIPWFVERGYRCIAFDRRGHGRSDRPSSGYDFDTLSDDLAAVIDHLDLRDITLVGHSTGGAEVAHYMARHGEERVARAVLVSAMLPYLMQADDNPAGIPEESIEGLIAAIRTDRPKWLAGQAQSFFATQRNPHVSPAMVDWMLALCLRPAPWVVPRIQRLALVTDHRSALSAITVPILVVHGALDFSAPIDLTGRRTAQRIAGAVLKEYPSAGHALIASHHEQFNTDVLEFIKG